MIRGRRPAGTTAVMLLVAASLGASTHMTSAREGPWRWIEVPMPSTGPSGHAMLVQDVAMVDHTRGWAVGAYGLLLRYADGRWRAAPSPTDQHLHSVQMTGAVDGWAVGERSTFLQLSGGTWTRVPVPFEANTIYDVEMLSSEYGWAVGYGGSIYRYESGAWRQVESPTGTTLYAVVAVDEQHAWAVGGSADLFRTTILEYREGMWRVDASFTRSADGFGDSLYDIAVGAEGTLYAAGNSGQLYRREGDRWTLSRWDEWESFHSIAIDDDGTVWIAGRRMDRALLIRADAGGRREVAMPPTRGGLRAVRTVGSDVWLLGNLPPAPGLLRHSYVLRYTAEVLPLRIWLPALPAN